MKAGTATAGLAAVMATALAASTAGALEIPLTITERAGVARSGNHVSSGIPLPAGAVADVAALGLFGDDGKAVPASFVLRQKYLADNSARWVTVHFLADVPASGTAKYVVKDKAGAAPAYPLKVEGTAEKVTVDTGAIRFTVVRDGFNVLNEAWFDPSGKGKYGKPVVEAGAAKLVANMVAGDYKVTGKTASPSQVSDPFDAAVKVNALEIEENTPARAVVKATGQFLRDGAPTLDFVARIYAVAGSAAVRVSFSVVNLTGSAWNTFYGFNELSLNVPAKLGAGLKYALSTSEGENAAGELKADQKATLLQPYSEHYLLGGAASGQGKAKSLLTRRLGWAAVSGSDATMVAAIRYFWQLHPKGLAAGGDGSVSLQIVPRQGQKAPVPEGITSQADTRVDFFTGAARTHELLLGFCAPGTAPAAVAMGVVDPLFAACKTSWYCQETRAEGPLWDSNPENFKPEHRELVDAYQKKVDGVLNECAGPVRRGGKRGTEEYGFFSYGCGTESKGIGEFIIPNDWLATRWDGNYYDFPRAVLVNFWRTGNLTCWDIAQDSALHLADVDIAHANPGNPKLAGIEHTCPSRGHFRQWWGGEPFGISGNMDSSKCQSLYDIYHMTGDAWFLDCGLLVASYSMNHSGGALRAIANRSTNLREAYEQTGDAKYNDANVAWLTKTLLSRAPDKSWDQYWMYGMASEALMDIYRQTGDAKWAQAVVNCCDSLINVYWIPEKQSVRDLNGYVTQCFGNAYEVTGNEMYLKKGLGELKATSQEYAGGTKTFAQQFRISPYFLDCLTKDFKPKPVVEKSNATK